MTVDDPESERADAVPARDAGVDVVPSPGAGNSPTDLDKTDPAPIA